jgi:hypothetical protein
VGVAPYHIVLWSWLKKSCGVLTTGKKIDAANPPDSTSDGPVDESPMLLDDTKHTTYIYDIDRELAGIEEEEKHILFLPDIEKALNAIPRAVLDDRPKPENELVLYGIPRSLTVAEEDKDAVRKAIIASRARAKTHSASSAALGGETATPAETVDSTHNPMLPADQMDVDL